MPTTRRRRVRAAVAPIQPAVLYLLKTGELPTKADNPEACDGWWDAFDKCGDSERLRADWQTVREELLEQWVQRAPGTRPWAWWEFEAPRVPIVAPGRPAHGELHPVRQRLGGVGTPVFEALNYAVSVRFGLPVSWVSAFDEAYYNGRARDIHGSRIGTEFQEGDFVGRAINPGDPPRFESEAAYLDRHGLLTAAERRHLPAAAFEPVPWPKWAHGPRPIMPAQFR